VSKESEEILMKEYVLPIIDFLLFDEEDILTASAAVNAWATMGDSVLDDTVSQPKIVNINTDKVKSFD
jgi:hypothetical protein